VAELRVRLFGQACLEVDGQPAQLTPTTFALLTRLVIADGAAVTDDQLYLDAWSLSGPVVGDYKTQVQKRVVEIRGAAEDRGPGVAPARPQRLLTERGRVTAYRLVLGRDAVDIMQFTDLLVAARQRAPEGKIELLPRALALWAGDPLRDYADQPWAAPAVRQLTGLRRTALLDLRDAYAHCGRLDEALELAERLALENPSDTGLVESLAVLTEQVRSRPRKRVVREQLADPRVAIVVMSGDLFGQEDANLVVGFTDTFDTASDRNIVISAASAQGQLLDRLYDGDRGKLDRDLRSALTRVPKASVETRSAKPRGKLTRYPVGTVATIFQPTRRVFAVAYSRLGNDLIARSGLPELRESLENLWDAVYRGGQCKPVAMPLIGSGLSRTGADHHELLELIIDTFLVAARRRDLCPELRVIVPPSAFDQLGAAEVLGSLREPRARSSKGESVEVGSWEREEAG
jgi:DNA-binding SARP family transcriptional activator